MFTALCGQVACRGLRPMIPMAGVNSTGNRFPTNMKNKILMAFAAISLTGSAMAATLTFSTYTASGAGDTSWVMTQDGIESVNFGGSDTTYGGITWFGTSVNGNQTYRQVSEYTFFHSVPGSAWANIAGSTFYPTSPTVALLHDGTFITNLATQDIGINGLTIGQEYMAKFVFADSRIDSDGHTMEVANLDLSSRSGTAQFGYADGRYLVVTATWTADATGQAFLPIFNGSVTSSILNGVQIVAIPEPGSALLGLLGLGSFVFLRRRRAS